MSHTTPPYTDAVMIQDVAEAPLTNQMLGASNIEGCTPQVFGRACWTDESGLVYNPDGSVNMAASPPPTHYLANGPMHNDALALLPEDAIAPPANPAPPPGGP